MDHCRDGGADGDGGASDIYPGLEGTVVPVVVVVIIGIGVGFCIYFRKE